MRWLFALALVVPMVSFAARADVGVPGTLSYQGRLLDASDQPVEGQHTFTFSIWDAAQPPATGQQPQPRWTATVKAMVYHGNFAVLLGDGSDGNPPFDASVFDGSYTPWMGVAVDGGTELSPRLPFASAPFAQLAGHALDSDRVGGKTLTDLDARYAQLGASSPQTGSISIDGTMTAASFAGDGSALTNLTAGNLKGSFGAIDSTGTVTAQGFIGDGSQLTNLTAANLKGWFGAIDSTGTVTAQGFVGDGSQLTNLTAANLTGSFGAIDSTGTVTAQDFIGDGSQLTNLTAGNIKGSFGAIDSTGTMTAQRFVGDGSGLTNLPAAQITGTIAASQIAPSVMPAGQNLMQDTQYFGGLTPDAGQTVFTSASNGVARGAWIFFNYDAATMTSQALDPTWGDGAPTDISAIASQSDWAWWGRSIKILHLTCDAAATNAARLGQTLLPSFKGSSAVTASSMWVNVASGAIAFGMEHGASQWDSTAGWHYYSHVDSGVATLGGYYVFMCKPGAAADVYIAMPKIEVGAIATPWEPAAADLASQSWSVRSTTGTIPPNADTGMIPLTGLTKTFILARPSHVNLTADGDQRTRGTGFDGNGCQVGYGFVVDGVQEGNQNWGQRIQDSPVANGTGHIGWSLSWGLDVGPGPHTISVETAQDSGRGCIVCSEYDGSARDYDACDLMVTATAAP